MKKRRASAWFRYVLAVGSVFALTTLISLIFAAYHHKNDTSETWHTYNNPTLGIQFKVPPDGSVVSTPTSENTYSILVQTSPMSDIDVAEQKALANGETSTTDTNEIVSSEQIIKSGSGYFKTYIALGDFSPCDLSLTRQVVFYHTNEKVLVAFVGSTAKISGSMPGFFTHTKDCEPHDPVWNWSADPQAPLSFYNILNNQNGTGAAQDWYDTGASFIKTIKLL